MPGSPHNKPSKPSAGSSPATCPSCAEALLGPYCHRCGEQRFKADEVSLGQVSQEVFSAVTDVDGKFLKSMVLLIRKPGQLTVDYLNGVRKSRLSPFQLLLMINVLFFVLASYRGHSTFTTQLQTHTQASNFWHQSVAEQMVAKHLATTGEAPDAYASRFNQRVETQAKSLVMLMVPLLALLVGLLFWRRRMIGHLVFATHLFCLILLVSSVLAPLVSGGLLWVIGSWHWSINELGFELIFSLIMFGLYGICFYASARRVYVQPAWLIGLKTGLFVVGVYATFLLYRMVLFFTTFYTL